MSKELGNLTDSNSPRNFNNIGNIGRSGFNAYNAFNSGGNPWGAVGDFGQTIYNFISNKNPSEYSDLEQTLIYPLKGASKGASYSGGNPWGAVGGALYGLGYSFKDDLGLDNSNFFTQLLFPIGMGDGGGLKINGQPVLDIL